MSTAFRPGGLADSTREKNIILGRKSDTSELDSKGKMTFYDVTISTSTQDQPYTPPQEVPELVDFEDEEDGDGEEGGGGGGGGGGGNEDQTSKGTGPRQQ